MGRNSLRARRAFLFLFAAAFAAVLAWMAGCDKISSTFRSLGKSRPKKERGPAHAPKRAIAGPKLAIILDDLGNDTAAAESIFALHEPLTISVLPFHPHSTDIAEEAKARGIEVMLHLPMKALGNELPEGRQLQPGMDAGEVARELGAMLESVPTAVGVNNHEGSMATTDAQLMEELMALLKQRSLYFVDSRTTAATVAFDAAKQGGLRCGFRNVPFLDDVEDVAAIRKQLELAVHGAKEKGSAIAIGHPHKETLEALHEMLPKAGEQGVELVFVSEIVK